VPGTPGPRSLSVRGPRGEDAIERQRAAAVDGNRNRQDDGEQVVLPTSVRMASAVGALPMNRDVSPSMSMFSASSRNGTNPASW